VHNGTKGSLDQRLNSGKGNCCEKARILVGLARAMGMKAQFVKVPGHVFSRINVNGVWMAIDIAMAGDTIVKSLLEQQSTMI